MKKITLGLLALFIMTFSGCETKTEALTSVSFDINPSFEIVLDSSNEVVNVLEKNEDASSLVADIDFSSMSFEEVLDLITNKAIEAGYLTEDNLEDILISFEDDQDETIVTLATDTVSDVLDENNITAQVNTQRIIANSVDKEQAEALNISLGKYELLSKVSSNTGEDITSLATRSITDIMNEVVASGNKIGNVLRNSKKTLVLSDDVNDIATNLSLALESKTELINEKLVYDLMLNNEEITEVEYNNYLETFTLQMENVNNTIQEYRKLLNNNMNQGRANYYYEEDSIKSETRVGLRTLLDEVEALVAENLTYEEAFKNGEMTEEDYNLKISANQETIANKYSSARNIVEECNLDETEKSDLLADLEKDYQAIINGDEASTFIRNEFNELKEKYYNQEITFEEFLEKTEQFRNNMDYENNDNLAKYIEKATQKAMIKNNYFIHETQIKDLLEAYENNEITLEEYQAMLEEIQAYKKNMGFNKNSNLDTILDDLNNQYKNSQLSTYDYDETLKALGKDKTKDPKGTLNDIKIKAKKDNNKTLYDSVTSILDSSDSEDL